MPLAACASEATGHAGEAWRPLDRSEQPDTTKDVVVRFQEAHPALRQNGDSPFKALSPHCSQSCLVAGDYRTIDPDRGCEFHLREAGQQSSRRYQSRRYYVGSI